MIPHSSHSTGSPINQRLCAGFNWPPAVVPAAEPVSISPEAVSRAGLLLAASCACLGSWSSLDRPPSRVVAIPEVSFQSRADGVTH